MNNFVLYEGTQVAQMRSRKSKGRSRSGCLSCRQRRIKCDECRPRCSKCMKHSLMCEYGSIDPAKEWQRSIVTFTTSSIPSSESVVSDMESGSRSTTDEAPMVHSERLPVLPILYRAPHITSDGFVNRDVQLLAHFTAATSYDILGSRDAWVQDGLQLAVQNDFLMHAMLMTGASHLQHLDPASYKDYSLQATYHLQRSLQSFRAALNGSVISISNNIDAIIGTAFLLVVHGYSNPNFRSESAASEPDSLFPHLSGIFDIIRRTHEYATTVIFQSICTPKLLPSTFPTNGPALNLILMVNTQLPDSGHLDSCAEIYVAVIESLTLVLDATASHHNLGNTPPDSLLIYLVQWLSFLPPEFVVLVNKHDAKALVIMAYYYAVVAFVLSKAKRRWWWMRERPVYMVKQIAAFLDDGWEVWMRWPMEMLETCRDESFKSMVGLDDHGYGPDLPDINTSNGAGLGILSNVQLHYGKIQA